MGWFPDQTGGLTRYSTDLGLALARKWGSGVPTVAIGPARDAPPWVVAVSSDRRPLPLRWLRYALAARGPARDAEVVDSHFALYGAVVLVMPRLRRLPLVVHFHGPWAEEFVANGARRDWRITAKRRLESLVYSRADAVVVTSEAFATVVRNAFSVPRDRVRVLGAGIDLGRFAPGSGHDARRRLGIGPGTFVVVAVRRLVARMGLDVLLDAWATMAGADRLLLVAGDGPLRSRLQCRAEELGLAGTVRFLGAVDDAVVVDCYRAADVSVVPSVAFEGFGLVVLESLACGTPVVATDSGGMAETLRRLDPGLVVPPGDAHALARRLDEARAGAAPSAASCRSFAEGYSWDALADLHDALYRSVAEAAALSPGPPR